MYSVVKSIRQNSPASGSIISTGDVLRKINGNIIGDVLDYQFHSYDSNLDIELHDTNGKVKLVSLTKPEGDDLGIEFDSFLMDKERVCENKCIFCFMNQLPKGMRNSLYYKDDDVRLSFLHGNYVTLTNLSKADAERIIEYRISPINVSVHSLNPTLRSFMMGGSRGGKSLDVLKMLALSGITLNCQIVCCPGVNSGKELRKTIEGLMKLGTAVNSVSVVPVGLTKYRERLHQLEPFNSDLARRTVRLVSHFARMCRRKRGSRVFFCADELYMTAGLELPSDKHYEEYPQLENGVGMMRLFITEFENALLNHQKSTATSCTDNLNKKLSIATGKLAYPFIKNLIDKASEKCGTIDCEVFAITNDFFGHGITVSGLITGGDILAQLEGKNLGPKLLIPQNMLKHGENVLLDDVTASELSEKLGVPVEVVGQSGNEFFNALFG
ncbi:MAG: DUF512 domain-containing protein [Oscillospiraceae bacterium]|nr:DUF512 domain-containing protein [Oscillospiraceae bacterium]MCL2279722.1 DUF512 domain-containing protein [Oscillospiraceae bacterium]